MTNAEVHEKLTGVFRSVFDDPELTIGETTTAKDVRGWDSIAHVSLIVAVEKAFRLRFTTKEVQALANVGDFIRLIERRLK
ncbi:MAG TPA: acyl carrier protein [Anaeromyxobacteraceae bacterium]|nr:acyl carrier protein [Anaeromyxobacteraceae bacterium]